MKKLIISLLITLGAFSVAQAQKPSFGLKAGLNFMKLKDTNADDATGFHIGAVVALPISKIGAMAEVVYSKEGGKNLELNYVNVPIMATYELIPGLRLHAGPQFKIKASAKVNLESPAGIDVSAEEEKVEDDIKNLNFDFVGGVEYKLPVLGLFAQARLVYGLGDLGDKEVKAKQGIFQLSVGYRF